MMMAQNIWPLSYLSHSSETIIFQRSFFVIAVRWLAQDAVLEFPPRAVLDPEAKMLQI